VNSLLQGLLLSYSRLPRSISESSIFLYAPKFQPTGPADYPPWNRRHLQNFFLSEVPGPGLGLTVSHRRADSLRQSACQQIDW
jgi:hypothetical protein